jgi:hypothetical protein
MHGVDSSDVAAKRLHDEGRHCVAHISGTLSSDWMSHIFLLVCPLPINHLFHMNESAMMR